MLVPNVPNLKLLSPREELYDKLLHRTAMIGVIGLGYVGLPLAVEKAKVGFSVLGFDRNPVRVGAVNRGQNYVKDVRDADLASSAAAGRIVASTDVPGWPSATSSSFAFPRP